MDATLELHGDRVKQHLRQIVLIVNNC